MRLNHEPSSLVILAGKSAISHFTMPS